MFYTQNIRSKLVFVVFFIIYGPTIAQNEHTFTIYYANNEANLTEENASKLIDETITPENKVIKSVKVVSSASNIGSVKYNQELSERRATGVYSFLRSNLTDSLIKIDVLAKGASNRSYRSKDEEQTDRKAIITIVYDTVVVENRKISEEEPTKGRLSGDLKIGDKVILDNILFVGGRHDLLEESYDDLDSLTEFVLKNPQFQLMILGHICCLGPDEDGEDFGTGKKNLSVARAQMIYNHLVDNGAIKERLGYRGMKANYPTGLGAKADRRVEIEVIGIYED